MVWFYNLISVHNSRIGLLPALLRQYGPAALRVCKFAPFLRNSQISKNLILETVEKMPFSLDGKNRPILPLFALPKRQFGSF